MKTSPDINTLSPSHNRGTDTKLQHKSTQNPLVRMLGFHIGGITQVRKKTIACVQNLYTSYTILLNFDSEM